RAGLVDAISITSPFDLKLKAEGFRLLAGPQDVAIALPTSGLAVANRALQQAHRFIFENKKDVLPQMIRYLEQTPEAAERSYELLTASLSRNGEITEQEWDILTEKKKSADEVRDFSLLREAQKELRIK